MSSSSINLTSIVKGKVHYFATLGEAKACKDGRIIRNGGKVRVGDRADALFNIVTLASLGGGTLNGDNKINLVGVPTLAISLRLKSTLIAEQWGIFGNNSGSPYSTKFINFMNATADVGVTDAAFPNKTITFDNTIPASFQSGCTYTGGRNTCIQPTVFDKRVFLTQNKENFEIVKMKSYINEGVGGENNTIGGGYWRFESCNGFDTKDIEVSRSFSGGIKMVLCEDFRMKNTKAKFNQFTGLELEGCSGYDIDAYDFSENGRYSADNTYKPLPAGWSGTHGGRGWTAGANANTVDQKHSRIRNGKCLFNSEYGFRCFTANTKGIKNLTISNFRLEDNGHPAGTYGTIVLASNKGVDALINSDVTGESDNIHVKDFEILRTVAYGTHISWDGYNHQMSGYKFKSTHAALYLLTPISLFGAKKFKMHDGESQGSKNHISFGSNFSADISIWNDEGVDCVRGFNGAPSAGSNSIKNSKYKHRVIGAVSGEHGLQLTTVEWVLNDVKFDGFKRNVEATGVAPNARMVGCTLINGVDADFYASSVSDQSGLVVYNNEITVGYPGFFSSVMYGGDGGLGRKRVIWNSNPSTGGITAGGNMNWVKGDRFEDSNSSTIWDCSVSGTPGTWV